MTGSGHGWNRAFVTLAMALLGPGVGAGEVASQEVQDHRAVPAAVILPPEYESAVERGWRSEDGSPGHSYWQQRSRYDIRAKLDPETGRIEGSVQILYAHDAPANLTTVWLHLYQNLHKEGSPRLEAQEITGGVTITSLAADGEELEERPLDEGPGYHIDGTLMGVRPSIRLEPGDTLELTIDWEVTLPQDGAGRMGYSEREVYFVAYWFPKMAVFDDLRGWDVEPYRGGAEFYDGFGDYSVELTVPAGWTVMATGDLTNPEDVLSQQTRDRLAMAATSDEKVVVALYRSSRRSQSSGSNFRCTMMVCPMFWESCMKPPGPEW